ncbi:hypothetical protein [Streptomyces sp. NPDC102264]
MCRATLVGRFRTRGEAVAFSADRSRRARRAGAIGGEASRAIAAGRE